MAVAGLMLRFAARGWSPWPPLHCRRYCHDRRTGCQHVAAARCQLPDPLCFLPLCALSAHLACDPCSVLCRAVLADERATQAAGAHERRPVGQVGGAQEAGRWADERHGLPRSGQSKAHRQVLRRQPCVGRGQRHRVH